MAVRMLVRIKAANDLSAHATHTVSRDGQRACWRRGVGMLVFVSLTSALMLGCESQNHRASGVSTGASASLSSGDSFRRALSRRVVVKAQHRQLENFALLRTRPEGLPDWVRQRMRNPVFGMNWSLAQRLPLPTYGAFWLVPANGYLCLVEQRYQDTVYQTCRTTKEVVAHGLFLAFLGAGTERLVYGAHRFVVGIVPDRTREVLIEAERSHVRVPAIGNTFVRRDNFSDSPNRLILTMAGS